MYNDDYKLEHHLLSVIIYSITDSDPIFLPAIQCIVQSSMFFKTGKAWCN